MLIRQVVSILALPFTVTVVVPWWITKRAPFAFTEPVSGVDLAVVTAGVACGVAGLALFVWSLHHFWIHGRGTLAPWDPPRRFVASGPYQFVRNPMISGVLFILVAEACVLRSWPLAQWAGLFTLINAIYIPTLEEPGLRARFGDPYIRYTRAVRRFLPRLTRYHEADVSRS